MGRSVGKSLLVETKRTKSRTATLAAISGTAVAVCLLVLTSVLVWQGYRTQWERTEDTARMAARLTAVHARWLVEASMQALEHIHDRIGTDPDVLSDTDGAFPQLLRPLPSDVDIAVYGADGVILLYNTPGPRRTDIGQTSFFRALAAGASLHISGVIMGQQDEGPEFAIVRRIEREGQFAGVAIAILSNRIFEDFALSLDMEPDSAVSLVRDDGALIARYPAPPGPINISEHEIFTRYVRSEPQQGAGSLTASPIDGRARIFAYEAVPDLPIVAIAGISTDATMTRFWRGVLLVGGMILLAGMGLIILSYYVWRQARKDEQTRLKLEEALGRNQLLFKEIHHRVKNNLQTVSSLIRLQNIDAETKKQMTNRIGAMISVHEHIYRSNQFERVDISDYLDRLIHDIGAGFSSEARIGKRLERVVVHRDNAMPIGLIFTEVLTNALKYAFPDGRPGAIEISLSERDGAWGALCVSDDGVGFDTTLQSKGIGRRLIEGLSGQIGGHVTLTAGNGTRFELVFPTEPPPETD